MQAVAQLERYKETVKVKEMKIKSKDSELKVLQQSLQRDWTNVSHLSVVSIFFTYRIISKDIRCLL